MVCVGTDASLRLWDPASGRCLQTIRAHSAEVSAMVWWPDGKSIITGSHDRKLVRIRAFLPSRQDCHEQLLVTLPFA